jgi:DNA-directed RNA polymerase specialized sigma24 family protein
MTCLNEEIQKHYKIWRDYAVRRKRSKNEGEELLHDILDRIIQSGTAEKIACEQERKGSLFYYVNRWIFLETMPGKRKQTIIEYRDYIEEPPDDITELPLKSEQIDVLVNWLTPYQMELIELRRQHGFQMNTLQKITGIGRTTLKKDLDEAINLLKQYTGNATPESEQ